MILLLGFAFLAGVVTVFSPCVLPVLPVVLSGTVGGRWRPLGISLGFLLSFALGTAFLSLVVRALGIPVGWLRPFAGLVIGVSGLTLIVPAVGNAVDRFVSRHIHLSVRSDRKGLYGGIIMGISLGVVWTPCVGPIFASVTSVVLVGQVTPVVLVVILSYALGTALSMFGMISGGRGILGKMSFAGGNPQNLQRLFGILSVGVAAVIVFGFDAKFENLIVRIAPGYSNQVTFLEQSPVVGSLIRQYVTKNSGKEGAMDKSLPVSTVHAPEIVADGQWFNGTPLKMADLKGKVVLVDFWTYSCINCIRTLPYIEKWYETYKDKGFVVLGIHTPEFEFEKNPENVGRAVKDFGLTYPIVQDNDYAMWNEYSNQYWPSKYFIDRNGYIRSSHFGEGGYDESEGIIRSLLAETGAQLDREQPNSENVVDAGTPETYLGYARGRAVQQVKKDQVAAYVVPDWLSNGDVGFGGNWKVGSELAGSYPGSVLGLGFNAKAVYIVMGTDGQSPKKVSVYLDGHLVGVDEAGDDVNEGVVTVRENRLYRIISLPSSSSHVLQLRFPDGGVDCYAFTFG